MAGMTFRRWHCQLGTMLVHLPASLPPTRIAIFTCAGSDEGRACQMSRTATFSMERLLTSIIGGFLFWNASPLSTSTPFRCGQLHDSPCRAVS